MARRQGTSTRTRGWQVDPSMFGNVILDELDAKYRAIAIDIFNGITDHAPVDTGTLRNNTHISIGVLDNRYIIRPKKEQQEVKDYFGGNQVMKVIDVPRHKFPTIYIQNNLPYADRIENGYSSKAPQGMFQLGFQEGIAKHS